MSKQCAACPWKKNAKLADIPGYRDAKHRLLDETIAEPGLYCPTGKVRIMACHHSTPGNDLLCVGWAYNQIGVGNNIALRLHARRDERFHKLEVDGEQHERFEDTLPENRKKRRRRT